MLRSTARTALRLARDAAPAALVFIALAITPAVAWPADGGMLPPANVGGGNVILAQSDNAIADLLARVQTLEGQNRTLTGQVEQLQNQLQRSLGDFQRYKDDTEYRLQALEGGKGGAAPTKRSQIAPPGNGPDVASSQPGPSIGAPPRNLGTLPANPDPGTAYPPGGDQDGTDPGNPDQGLDQTQQIDPNARPGPMDLTQLPDQGSTGQPPRSSLTAPGLPGIAVNTDNPPPGANTQMASLPATPEDEYAADYHLIEGRNYEAAELAFRKFLSDHPKDKRVADAHHWLGESLYQRQQYRDAAEEFLKVTTSYSNNRRAPSSMLRLGMSLAALGEKDAACATLQAIGQKYPNAGPTIKSGVDRETKRNAC